MQKMASKEVERIKAEIEEKTTILRRMHRRLQKLEEYLEHWSHEDLTESIKEYDKLRKETGDLGWKLYDMGKRRDKILRRQMLLAYRMSNA